MPIKRWVFSIAAAVVATAICSVSQASATTSGQALPHTKLVVVRPVHENGTPVHGYQVVHETHGSGFTCAFHSPVSVSSGVAWCGASADATIACWKSQQHTVLCLRDPRVRKLVRIRYSGTYSAGHRVKHPLPEALDLRRVGDCSVRIGGAWGPVAKRPNWVGYYSCSHGASVYGPQRLNGGIDRSVNPWLVHVVRFNGHTNVLARPDRVAVAYFVGTAK
ncbi:MAG TPA: hypothetical protein VFE40_14270 [Jatrophihabitantaceae bacterium]|jgi:microcompartment protein CcmK/EutM|nr:hypothetical protein [Jatrophihabitantaceae bacterium]